jgi:hypothetical protein
MFSLLYSISLKKLTFKFCECLHNVEKWHCDTSWSQLKQHNPQRSQPKEELIKTIFIWIFGHPIVNHYQTESMLLFKNPPEGMTYQSQHGNHNEIQCFLFLCMKQFCSILCCNYHARGERRYWLQRYLWRFSSSVFSFTLHCHVRKWFHFLLIVMMYLHILKILSSPGIPSQDEFFSLNERTKALCNHPKIK